MKLAKIDKSKLEKGLLAKHIDIWTPSQVIEYVISCLVLDEPEKICTHNIYETGRKINGKWRCTECNPQEPASGEEYPYLCPQGKHKFSAPVIGCSICDEDSKPAEKPGECECSKTTCAVHNGTSGTVKFRGKPPTDKRVEELCKGYCHDTQKDHDIDRLEADNKRMKEGLEELNTKWADRAVGNAEDIRDITRKALGKGETV